MAQNADGPGGNTAGTDSDKSVVIDPADPNSADPNAVDFGITNSIIGAPDNWNSNADQNCPVNPQGAQPDASNRVAGTVSPTVNDNHCGK
ncbi:hypothetical protein [Mesorhizobium sp. STM 4661]|uniref:hypothetical protein n=1 Tax=Mesorhizobium sp. STM 4661 TaxID=1297570 RepID=UPI0002BEC228|nr:hypothetical protein [Mesorhizobium sp. STM 4661]CCV14953.1 conserved hypothetical protein [Mesorhizobium sp. STM 4661]